MVGKAAGFLNPMRTIYGARAASGPQFHCVWNFAWELRTGSSAISAERAAPLFHSAQAEPVQQLHIAVAGGVGDGEQFGTVEN